MTAPQDRGGHVLIMFIVQVIQEDGDGGKVVVCRKKTEVPDLHMFPTRR